MVRRVSRKDSRDELLDDLETLGRAVILLSREENSRKFVTGVGNLMAVRTGRPFLCLYLKGLKGFENEPFVRTFITDDRGGRFVISLISDEIIKSKKLRQKYLKRVINYHNPLNGVALGK